MMKKQLIILLLGLSLSGLAQQIAPFNRTITPLIDSGIYRERIYSIVSTDSNYYLLMFVTNDSINSHLVLVKTDLQGNKLAHKDLASDTSGYFTCYADNTLLLDKDTNLLVTGTHWYSNEHHGQLVKLNTNLDILWDKVYHMQDSLMGPNCSNGRNIFTAIRQTPDGGYILNGFYWLNCDYSQNVQKLFLQKIDVNGNIEWLKLYPNLSWSFDIELASDSGYFVPTAINSIPTVVYTDQFGNVTTNISNIPSLNLAIYDSNYIISAAYFWVDNPPSKLGLDIAKINIHNQNIEWTRKYRPLNNTRLMELYQFMSIEVSNGFIYVGGSGIHYDQSDAYKGHKGYMLKLNQAGDSLWSHFYDYNPNEYNELNQFYDFHFHSDNEIVAVGYHELRNPDYTYFSQGWIVKMDSNGMAPGSYTISMEETQLVIKKQKPLLYPNPTTDNFHLRFEENQNQDLQLSIFSISGTLVKQQQLPAFAYEYRVDIQELKSGVYTVRLMSENQVIFSDKIIKR